MEAIMQVIKGQDIQDGYAAYSLVKSLLKGGALQVFKNEEASQEVRDCPAFTKCLVAVTEHVFPKKAYKTQKKYIWNIRKPLRLESCKWISRMDGVPYQWKLQFKKEGFDLSSSTLKEFLDMCVHLEEAEIQKLFREKIACAEKEHGKDRKRKHQGKP
eukprot:274513-Ditylum_brightwellii.AAC.1